MVMKTAVEWVEENLTKSYFELDFTHNQRVLEIAMIMEKHQIVKAAASAYEDMFGTDGTEYGEKYYDKLTQES
jgi:hypothetical protein